MVPLTRPCASRQVVVSAESSPQTPRMHIAAIAFFIAQLLMWLGYDTEGQARRDAPSDRWTGAYLRRLFTNSAVRATATSICS